MNILFHLITKDKVAYINEDATLRQAMEKMEHHRYTAVPVISEEGKYVGVLREGDILWYIKKEGSFAMEELERIRIDKLPRKKDHKHVSIDANIDELIELSIDQNFIPVTDDRESFIGIITRKSIITYLVKNFKNKRK